MITIDGALIKSFAEKYIADVRTSMDNKGVTASGNFNRSLQYRQTVDTLIIEGPAYAGAIESGRKPSEGGQGVLRAIIRKWIDVKGITPTGKISKDSLAYLITRKIHQEGTMLYSGRDYYGRTKPSKVIQGVTEDGRIEKLSQELIFKIIDQVKTDLTDSKEYVIGSNS